jgi:hypothetical protein
VVPLKMIGAKRHHPVIALQYVRQGPPFHREQRGPTQRAIRARRVSGVEEVMLARYLGNIIVAACSLQHPAAGGWLRPEPSRHVKFGEIISE